MDAGFPADLSWRHVTGALAERCRSAAERRTASPFFHCWQLHCVQFNCAIKSKVRTMPSRIPPASRPVAVSRRAPRAGSALALDAQLCFALHSSALAMTRRYRPLLEGLGLTYPQYLVMLALWEADGLSVTALGERLYLDSGTLTPLLKRLEAGGLLHRTRASDDERRVVVTLTPAGRALRRRAQAVPAALAAAMGCGTDELATLTETLKRLRGTLMPDPDSSPAARGPHPAH